jgi:hypothetical protein
MLHIYAALAEQERTLISQRTKAALAAAKARGVKLGNPNLDAIRGSGGEADKAEAERFAGTVLPIIKQVKKAGATTLQQIADALNDRGVATAHGGSWYPSNVQQRPGPRLSPKRSMPGSRPDVDPGGGRGRYRANPEICRILKAHHQTAQTLTVTTPHKILSGGSCCLMVRRSGVPALYSRFFPKAISSLLEIAFAVRG